MPTNFFENDTPNQKTNRESFMKNYFTYKTMKAAIELGVMDEKDPNYLLLKQNLKTIYKPEYIVLL